MSRAGCLVLGRTALAPLAQRTPAPATRNPAVPAGARARTPGGSSSGSAAAVAGGLCDLALGTQVRFGIGKESGHDADHIELMKGV